MPVKKQNTKKQVHEPVIIESVNIEPVIIESVNTKPIMFGSGLQSDKQIAKPGRTILVKSKSNDVINLNKYEPIIGLVSKSEINQHNSLFLTFDTIANSETAFSQINSDYNVKYSYYKIFFTLSTNVTTSNYESTKNEIMKYIESVTEANMLYCKFYRKNSEYMNCGDLIVDTIDSMKNLISKESTLKQFKTDNFTGTFYRFNNSKYKTSSTNN